MILDNQYLCPNCKHYSAFTYIPALDFGRVKLDIELVECHNCSTKTTLEAILKDARLDSDRKKTDNNR